MERICQAIAKNAELENPTISSLIMLPGTHIQLKINHLKDYCYWQ